jgi:hypothetical protein
MELNLAKAAKSDFDRKSTTGLFYGSGRLFTTPEDRKSESWEYLFVWKIPKDTYVILPCCTVLNPENVDFLNPLIVHKSRRLRVFYRGETEAFSRALLQINVQLLYGTVVDAYLSNRRIPVSSNISPSVFDIKTNLYIPKSMVSSSCPLFHTSTERDF